MSHDSKVVECPKTGCNVKITGDNVDELRELMVGHKDLQHRESFEKTPLGRLPLEILTKIVGYAAAGECFQHHLKLGLVCKRMDEVVKLANILKDIDLTCCPLPPMTVFEEMLKNCGTQIKVIWDINTVEYLYHALLKKGDGIQEISLDSYNDIDKPFRETADVLDRLTELNPKALTRITSKHLTLTLTEKQGDEDFISRIVGLTFSHVARMTNDIWVKIVAHVLHDIPSMKKVILHKVNSRRPQQETLEFKDTMSKNYSLRHYDISWTAQEHENIGHRIPLHTLEVSITRSVKFPNGIQSLDSEAEAGFTTFLEVLREEDFITAWSGV